ncbi:hypothetical protein SS50377_24724 [Spironucleus salmonicida]|uniref:Uncharacterized protein n=1 Tax=Spironucleus salmonicida TaxID=348837 RepID=V6LJ15_9EUKA|nr:hypothetical protein SS50377_24724 [Spironucleus salmonicida]|eukprot:EST44605.1 Hypothetical protein SS50377_15610 [Spironucleus salmonicida]
MKRNIYPLQIAYQLPQRAQSAKNQKTPIQFRRSAPIVTKTNIYEENTQIKADNIELLNIIETKNQKLIQHQLDLETIKLNQEQTNVTYQAEIISLHNKIQFLHTQNELSERKRERIQFEILQKQINQNRYNKYITQKNTTVTMQVLGTIITHFASDLIKEFHEIPVFEQIKDFDAQLQVLEDLISDVLIKKQEEQESFGSDEELEEKNENEEGEEEYD